MVQELCGDYCCNEPSPAPKPGLSNVTFPLELFSVAQPHCWQLVAVVDSACFEDFWANHASQYEGFAKGTCPSQFNLLQKTGTARVFAVVLFVLPMSLSWGPSFKLNAVFPVFPARLFPARLPPAVVAVVLCDPTQGNVTTEYFGIA
jgi:hypothetical protein